MSAPSTPWFLAAAKERPTRPALVEHGVTRPYGEVVAAARTFRDRLRRAARRDDLDERPVAFLAGPGHDFVAALLGTWLAGGLATPLGTKLPDGELRHVLGDSGARLAFAADDRFDDLRRVAAPLGIEARPIAASVPDGPPGPPPASDWEGPEHPVRPERAATLLYTSGTTGKPKGAVVTHAALAHRVAVLREGWRFGPADRLLHVLPLNHVHGLENALLCPLTAGSVVELLAGFDAVRIWERLARGRVTVFMAVPTMYAKLVAAWEAAPAPRRERWSAGARRARLMCSGSAALPEATLARWEEIAGHRLLERYGMTEIGMALANPYDGPRVAGAVGAPLPGVEVRRVGDDGNPAPAGAPGELWIRSPSLFREYLGNAAATADAFRDGWFRTGDMAVEGEGGYRLLGRRDSDVFNVGGALVSAPEIEACFREHPAVDACAVVGLPDAVWGRRVGLAVVPRAGVGPGRDAADATRAPEAALDLDALRAWAAPRLAPEKLPTRLALLDALPRNALGKIVKGLIRFPSSSPTETP